MKKFILSIIMVALLGGVAWAYDFSAGCSSGQTLYYTITSSTSVYRVMVVSYNNGSPYYDSYNYPTGNLTIPSTVTYEGRSYDVTSINANAFYGCNGLNTVTISNAITSIGETAFGYCSNLTMVNFNATSCTSMGSSSRPVFMGCESLTTLNIGDNVTRIPEYAFRSCNGLTTVNFNATNCTSMGSSSKPVFSGCESLTTLNIGENVTNIPENAFRGCSGLTSVTIGNSVTSIGSYAFYNCSGLTSVTIPNSVTSIGSYAFYNCSGLTSVNYTGDIAGWCGISFGLLGSNPLEYAHNLYINNRLVTELNIPESVTEIKASAFSGATCLTSVTIPNSVTSIGNYAFRDCSGLTSVTIGNSVESIGSYAFSGCSGLAGELLIPNSVTSIGDNTFYGCSGLTSVTIPNSVTSIGSYAFKNCSGLTTVNFNATNCTTMGGRSGVEILSVFSGCTSFAILNIGDEVTNIPDYAFNGWTGLTTVTIPNAITSIGEGAFGYCSNLATVNFNATNCTTMGSSSYSVFAGCTSLATLNVGNNVTYFPSHAFINYSEFTRVNYAGTIGQWCNITFADQSANPLHYAHNLYINDSLITDLVIPETVTEINGYAFAGATCLTSGTIPNSVTNIGRYAFSDCSELTDMSLGESVATIGVYAFQGCSGLTGNFIIPNTVTSIDSCVFRWCAGLTSVTIPNSVTSIGFGAFAYCSGLTSITIPNSVTSIGAQAFQNCTGLTSVTIPNSVTNIANGVFSGCTGLPSVTLPSYVTSISSSLFYGCSGLTSIIIPNSVSSIGSSAFYQCSGLTEFTIPNNVTSIGDYAFKYCSNLSLLIIGNSVSSIGDNAFLGCNEVDTIIVKCLNPPTLTRSFSSYTAAVFVPCNTLSRYSAATYWSNFTNMSENAMFRLTLSSANPQWGTARVTQQPNCTDFEAIIAAYPEQGYHFVRWTDGNTDNPRSVILGGYRSFTAEFAISQYTITVESADETTGTVSGGGTYDFGTEIQISATPADGYGFVAWNDGNTDNPRTILVSEDATYTANFVAWHTITVISADETIGTVSGGGTYYEGSQVEISAIPAEGFGFVAWNDGNTDNPRTIIVTEDATYTATFAAWRTITVTSADETIGTATGGGTYLEGLQVEISAIPADHYHFVQWTDGNTDNPRTITVVEDTTFTAEFAIDRFTVTVESADSTMGTVSESGTYDYGTEIEISASASEHYHFVQWSDGNTDNPRMITVVEDTTFTAEFAIDQHTITVESADTEMGTVSEGGTYDYGTEIQISASARDGYQFASWNDDNTDNPRYITVTSDATYIATFIPAVGIDESIATEIALFPNPASDLLNISSSETISEIEIVNVMGQVVKRIEVNSDNAACDVEDLKAGVYVVRIYSRPFGSAQVAALRKFIKE